VVEALVYVAEDPITVVQVAASLEQPAERIKALFDQLMAEYDMAGRGIQIREVAGGYRMATKPEHHDAVRAFVKSLKPPLKLSLPALETLAVIAYKQPVTAPEVKEIRGVQGTGVLSTLLDRKLIAEAGRKNVIGKPILYKTTKEFLIQFGLKDLAELPTLKEFEEIRRMAFADSESAEEEAKTDPVSSSETAPVAGEKPENVPSVPGFSAEAGGEEEPVTPPSAKDLAELPTVEKSEEIRPTVLADSRPAEEQPRSEQVAPAETAQATAEKPENVPSVPRFSAGEEEPVTPPPAPED
jgi:segregation and condensation protein B